MNTETTDAGAEAGAEAVNTSGGEGQASSPFPANYDAGGNVDAGDVAPGGDAGAEGQAGDKAALPPLTVEEYQKRHDNLNGALRESRNRERGMRDELTQLRATVDQMRASQPQAFERFVLESSLKDFAEINWKLWEQQNPEAAHNGWQQYQAARQRMADFEEQDRASAETGRAQQAQNQFNAMSTTLAEQEAAFRESKPDYDKAVAFLRDAIVKEANEQGYFGDDAMRQAAHQIVQIGLRVHAAGQDLAEFSYNAAVQRGYKAAADIAPMVAGEAAAKTISNLGTAGGSGGGSFEEQMGNLSGAAGRAFWEKAKKTRYS